MFFLKKKKIPNKKNLRNQYSHFFGVDKTKTKKKKITRKNPELEKQKAKRRKRIKQLITIFFFSLFILLSISFVVLLLLTNSLYSKYIFSPKYKPLESSNNKCSQKTDKKEGIITILHINILKNQNGNKLIYGQIFIHKDDRLNIFELDNITLNQSTNETLLMKLDSNMLYLDLQEATENLENQILRERYLKIDLSIFSFYEEESNILDFSEVIDSYNADPITKLINILQQNDKIQRNSFSIQSELCKDDFEKLIVDLKHKSKERPEQDAISALENIINFNFIIKEQLGVEIYNKSSVKGWGQQIQKILENYKVQVVKVSEDTGSTPTTQTKVYIDEININSETLKIIKNILSQGDRSKSNSFKVYPISEIEKEKIIFSDIYIELGSENVF